MRSEIFAGAIFPDYKLSDHTAKRRKLSERALPRDEMPNDITLYWLTDGSRRPVRSPDRPVGTLHEEKTMTTFELDIASIRDRTLLNYPWKEMRKEL